MIDFKNKKVAVFGIQGSGKTFFVENSLVPNSKRAFIYLIHAEDFRTVQSRHEVFIPRKLVKGKSMLDKSRNTFDNVLGQIIETQKRTGRYDLIVVDEADLFFPKQHEALEKFPNIQDLIDSHRHYGLSVVAITRRPQILNTDFTETSSFLFVFAMEGKNVKEYLNKIHSDFEELMPKLKPLEHNFVMKEIGKPPKLFSKIERRVRVNDNKKEN